MSNADFDLAICGAGPTGCALALLLAQYSPHPERIALIGRLPANNQHSSDPRAIALNYGSRQLLQAIDGWPQHSAPIDTVHVSQQGYLGCTLIEAADMQVPILGAVVSYDALIQQLHEAVARSPIHFIQTDAAVTPQAGQTVHIQLPNTDTPLITAQLAVQSDGHRPVGVSRDYQQHAVLATLRASHPIKGRAYERFTTTGPFALLPHPQSDHHYALVWCLAPHQAEHYRSLPKTEFEQACERTFGPWLGCLQLASERFVFPLSLHAGAHQVATRIVAIGNAAQTMHPVAGQGLNLGLRDVAQLAQALRSWLIEPHQDPTAALHHFTQLRRTDRWLTIGITDTLARIFTTPNNLIHHALGLGLFGLGMADAPRRSFTRHLLHGLRS